MNIGSTVYASSDFHDIQGLIVSGYDIETGERTALPGRVIDLDGVVTIRALDDGATLRLKGWMWHFEPAEA